MPYYENYDNDSEIKPVKKKEDDELSRTQRHLNKDDDSIITNDDDVRLKKDYEN